jgi:hypothetical protein
MIVPEQDAKPCPLESRRLRKITPELSVAHWAPFTIAVAASEDAPMAPQAETG